MPKVMVDLGLCQGYANCINIAPDIFDLNDDDQVVLLSADFATADQPRIEDAVQGCPVAALSIADS
jgi:3-phenylpropionate/trans-cinnamate dioxygenase ferredoxin reductase subunit